MRILAILCNLGLIGFVVFQLVKEGVPRGDDIFFVIGLGGTPIVSLLALLFQSPSSAGSSWLSLYLERKRLEERKRIERLQSENHRA